MEISGIFIFAIFALFSVFGRICAALLVHQSEHKLGFCDKDCNIEVFPNLTTMERTVEIPFGNLHISLADEDAMHRNANLEENLAFFNRQIDRLLEQKCAVLGRRRSARSVFASDRELERVLRESVHRLHEASVQLTQKEERTAVFALTNRLQERKEKVVKSVQLLFAKANLLQTDLAHLRFGFRFDGVPLRLEARQISCSPRNVLQVRLRLVGGHESVSMLAFRFVKPAFVLDDAFVQVRLPEFFVEDGGEWKVLDRTQCILDQEVHRCPESALSTPLCTPDNPWLCPVRKERSSPHFSHVSAVAPGVFSVVGGQDSVEVRGPQGTRLVPLSAHGPTVVFLRKSDSFVLDAITYTGALDHSTAVFHFEVGRTEAHRLVSTLARDPPTSEQSLPQALAVFVHSAFGKSVFVAASVLLLAMSATLLVWLWIKMRPIPVKQVNAHVLAG